ncbi:hypothetical protein LSAT2_018794 [Lamellibrachia satsuma]|nr:hypothetical protein LSAT2_018794 [Lamellibrachia satsuma]
MVSPETYVIPNNDTFKAISATVESLFAILSLLTNATILIAFARCRQLHKHSSNVLLIFLASADLMYVVVSVPSAFLVVDGYPHSYYGCLFIVCSTTLPLQLTVSTLFVIAVDRFIAIRWPFKHAEYCSRSRIVKYVLLLWVIGAGFIYLPMFGWNLGWINNGKCSFHRLIDKQFRIYAIFIPASLAPLLAMSCIYAYIFRIVLKMSTTVGPASDVDENRRKAFISAKKCGVIVLAYVVFILPVDIMNSSHLWFGYVCVACTKMATWGLLIHGFVCPIIYLFQNKLLRTVVLLTLRCRRIDEHQLSLVDGGGM